MASYFWVLSTRGHFYLSQLLKPTGKALLKT
jgi:hypothetical protein